MIPVDHIIAVLFVENGNLLKIEPGLRITVMKRSIHSKLKSHPDD